MPVSNLDPISQMRAELMAVFILGGGSPEEAVRILRELAEGTTDG